MERVGESCRMLISLCKFVDVTEPLNDIDTIGTGDNNGKKCRIPNKVQNCKQSAVHNQVDEGCSMVSTHTLRMAVCLLVCHLRTEVYHNLLCLLILSDPFFCILLKLSSNS